MRVDRERSVFIIVYYCLQFGISECGPIQQLKNFPLIFLISISGNGTWIELEGGWWDGKKNEVFIFLIFFVNKLYSFYHHHY